MTGNKTHKRSKITRITSVLFLVVLVGVALALATFAYSYIEGKNAYERVAEIAFEAPPASPTNGEVNEQQPLILTVDWDALAAVNPDIVGWIYLPDTAINYPIVRGSDNERYLTYNFNGQRGANWLPTYGTPFLLAENAADFSDANNVIQAHNMANGTMFAKIPELMDATEFNAYRKVYLLTPSGNYRLTSISMVVSRPYETILQTSFGSQEEFQSYVQGLINRSVVSPEPAAPLASEVNKLFMFSTCTSDGGQYRCVLVCAVTEFEQRSGEFVRTRSLRVLWGLHILRSPRISRGPRSLRISRRRAQLRQQSFAS
ncbi:MAG: class B sortase [Coriobacteriales bacterium]|jgi:sortase B|nr:class B sortase [Coriobacteriales bacterium]